MHADESMILPVWRWRWRWKRWKQVCSLHLPPTSSIYGERHIYGDRHVWFFI